MKTFEEEKKKYLEELSQNRFIQGFLVICDYYERYSDSNLDSYGSYILHFMNKVFSNEEDQIGFLEKINRIKSPWSMEDLEFSRSFCTFLEDLFFIMEVRFRDQLFIDIDSYRKLEKQDVLPIYDCYSEYIMSIKNHDFREFSELQMKNELFRYFYGKDEDSMRELVKKIYFYEYIEYYRPKTLETLLWANDFSTVYGEEGYFQESFQMFREDYMKARDVCNYDFIEIPLRYLLFARYNSKDSQFLHVASREFHKLLMGDNKDRVNDIQKGMEEELNDANDFLIDYEIKRLQKRFVLTR